VRYFQPPPGCSVIGWFLGLLGEMSDRPGYSICGSGESKFQSRTSCPPNQEYECEHMTFNPWNCLEQHRPLGSINRMQLAVYLASLQVWQKLNMVAS
jgi:hypothetical protein